MGKGGISRLNWMHPGDCQSCLFARGEEAWQLLKTIRAVEIDLGNGEQKRSVIHGSARAERIFKAVGVKNLDPDSRAKPAKKAA